MTGAGAAVAHPADGPHGRIASGCQLERARFAHDHAVRIRKHEDVLGGVCLRVDEAVRLVRKRVVRKVAVQGLLDQLGAKLRKLRPRGFGERLALSRPVGGDRSLGEAAAEAANRLAQEQRLALETAGLDADDEAQTHRWTSEAASRRDARSSRPESVVEVADSI